MNKEKVDLRKRSTTATKNYIVETRQGPAPTNVPSEVQCKDRWYVGSLHDQARHQSGMYATWHALVAHSAFSSHGAACSQSAGRMRPYSGESTPSRPIWEVKHRQAQLVLR